MSKAERIKEEIGWLKLVFGILVAIDVLDLPPFFTPRPWKLSLVPSGTGLDDGG
jgi:hypothetical protein